MSDEIARLGAVELGRRIAAKQVTSVQATRGLLDRIALLDPHIRAFAVVDADSALRRAAEMDAEIAAGKSRGPLHGVPIAVKDLCDAAGLPTVAGMPLRRSLPPAEKDSTVVARLKDAGCVLLGKLQMTEGACAAHHRLIPKPVNPFDPTLWTGASSSGSGAGTATLLCFASLGSDTGGSIRFPSAACGLTGLKPTWGRVSRAGVFPLAPSLDHVGPMCRSAEDAAAVMAVIAGEDADDPTAERVPVPDYLAEIGKGVGGMTVGICRGLLQGCDADVRRAIEGAEKAFRELGARVIDLELPDFLGPALDHRLMVSAECAAVHADVYPQRKAEYGPLAKSIQGAEGRSAAEMAAVNVRRADFTGLMDRALATVDVALMPVLNDATVPLAVLRGNYDPDGAGMMLRTAPIDVAGVPSLTVPGGFTASGAPVGFQIVARKWGEAEVLRAGHAYQTRTAWHTRRPDLKWVQDAGVSGKL
ncbi:amidase [Hyaloraphidium curvatum]|nr:amidase [Hyaloraphidium curvatum]